VTPFRFTHSWPHSPQEVPSILFHDSIIAAAAAGSNNERFVYTTGLTEDYMDCLGIIPDMLIIDF
jgi:hypothetical protein